MKKKEKQMIGILILVAAIIITIIYFATRSPKEEPTSQVPEENKVVEEFVQVLEDGTKLNTSTKLKESKIVDGLTIGNIQLTNQNNQTVLLADVTNNSGKDIGDTLLDIILLDKQGNEIKKVSGIISALKVGETTQLNAGTTLDKANAYDFKVVIK